MIEKYGLLNGSESTKEVEVIKEVIKYVEVPVVEEKEVIKIEYVDVPVEKIVTKEVIVEKIVEVDKSTDKLKMMTTTLQNLRNDLSLKNDKITELEKINQELQKSSNLQSATFMKGSNLNSRI
jgi:hypothetical protein